MPPLLGILVNASSGLQLIAFLGGPGAPRPARDVGAKQEVVRVQAVNPANSPPTFQALFTKDHAAGFRITNMGNPGPHKRFDPRTHPAVVPYFSVVE